MNLPSKRSAMLSLWAPSGSHAASPAIHRWPEVVMMAQRRARCDYVSAISRLVQERREGSIKRGAIDFGIEPARIGLATQPGELPFRKLAGGRDGLGAEFLRV